MKKKTLLLAGVGIFLFVFFAQPEVRADDVYTLILKKQEKKETSRWSLSQWLETRDRMRLMDLWLALHSPSPYEFFISGSYVSGEQGVTRQSGHGLSAGAYASIFGLQFEREKLGSLTNVQGLFNLRIFGYHVQGTNITLHTGFRQQSAGAHSARAALAGVSASLYLAKYFGIRGMYRHYFDAIPGSSSVVQTKSGSRVEGGAFIDFRFVRVGADYFNADSMKGFDAGLTVFF